MVLKSFRFHVFYFLLKIKALKRGAVLSRLKEGGQRRVEREMRADGG